MATDEKDVQFARAVARRIVGECLRNLTAFINEVEPQDERHADRAAIVTGCLAAGVGQLIGNGVPTTENLKDVITAACDQVMQHATKIYSERTGITILGTVAGECRPR